MAEEDRRISLAGKVLVDKLDAQLLEDTERSDCPVTDLSRDPTRALDRSRHPAHRLRPGRMSFRLGQGGRACPYRPDVSL